MRTPSCVHALATSQKIEQQPALPSICSLISFSSGRSAHEQRDSSSGWCAPSAWVRGLGQRTALASASPRVPLPPPRAPPRARPGSHRLPFDERGLLPPVLGCTYCHRAAPPPARPYVLAAAAEAPRRIARRHMLFVRRLVPVEHVLARDVPSALLVVSTRPLFVRQSPWSLSSVSSSSNDFSSGAFILSPSASPSIGLMASISPAMALRAFSSTCSSNDEANAGSLVCALSHAVASPARLDSSPSCPSIQSPTTPATSGTGKPASRPAMYATFSVTRPSLTYGIALATHAFG
eukprot:scaffold24992_cov63-Phaeocystis_antarctica.AAC.1